MERKDTTLPVKKTTKSDLDDFKAPGQSYDGAITQLLEQAKQEVEA
jgi:hypothetical protein